MVENIITMEIPMTPHNTTFNRNHNANNVHRISDYQYKNMYKAVVDVDADKPISKIKDWLEKYNLGYSLLNASSKNNEQQLMVEFEVATMNRNELLAGLSEFYDLPIADVDDHVYK